jgi:glycosyltransferase involved in cell wall biosynthesis
MNSSSKAKIILLTNQLHTSPSGGRELLCKLNHDMLKDIYGERCLVLELPKNPIRSFKSIISAFKGHIDGLSNDFITDALQQIQAKKIEKIFVDGSNFGEFVKAVKMKFPQLQVCTFFHNVEARFFLGALRQTKTPRALAVLIVNYLAEKKAVRYSDKIICLNERDSQLLNRVYGRTATHISAMALQDKFLTADVLPLNETKEKFALFVGGTFYANLAGITWFVKYVAPHIHTKTYVVGRGFEKYRNELELEGKVEVVGEVESLAQWYLNSHFVIAPIFDGSGMKTKVAEALMFGKKIIGTPEAFSGYEDIVDHAGWVCAKADDFVRAIENAKNEAVNSFNPELRRLYEENYSYSAARLRLAEILS